MSELQPRPIALFDMDGSLCDYDKALRRDLNKIKSPDEVIIDDIRQLEHSPHMNERMKLIKSQTGWWENLEPLEVGMNIYKILERIGFDIHILTQGPKNTVSAWTEKVRWCHNYLNNTDVTITRNKSLVYGKILVDDYPEYALNWLKWRTRGLVIMPQNNQNKDVKHPNIILCDGDNIEYVEIKCIEVFEKFKKENQQ